MQFSYKGVPTSIVADIISIFTDFQRPVFLTKNLHGTFIFGSNVEGEVLCKLKPAKRPKCQYLFHIVASKIPKMTISTNFDPKQYYNIAQFNYVKIGNI